MEWLAVLAAGALGGAVGTLLPTGTDMPSPGIIRAMLKEHRRWELVYHFSRNMVLGAVASFVLWTMYDSTSSFESAHIAPRSVGASLVVGIGGGWFLDRLLRKQQEAQSSETALAQLNEAFKLWIDRTTPDAPATDLEESDHE